MSDKNAEQRFRASVMAWTTMANPLNNQGINIYPALLHDLESTQRGLIDNGHLQAADYLEEYVSAAQCIVDYIDEKLKSGRE